MPARQAKLGFEDRRAQAGRKLRYGIAAAAHRTDESNLDRFAGEVQRLFPLPKGSAVDAFEDLAPRYPVFELQLLKDTAAASP